MIERKLYDVRGIELEVGQLIAYGRSVGRSVSPSLARIVELLPCDHEKDHWQRASSDDKVMIVYLFEAFGVRMNKEKPVGVMPERVMVINGVPDGPT